MNTRYQFFRLLLITSIFFIQMGCGSDDSGGNKSGNNDNPTTTILNHNFVFFNATGASDPTVSLFKYSEDDQSITKIGDGAIDEVDAGYDKYTKINIIFQDKLYFSADDGTNGFEIWVYDYNQPEVIGSNPKMLKDINPSGDSFPYGFTEMEGKLYFGANDGTNGYELWVYDPAQSVSSTNPQLVYDIRSGAGSASPQNLLVVAGKLYMKANNGTEGNELFVFDPNQAMSATNPQMLLDLRPGVGGSLFGAYLTKLQDKIYFSAQDDISHGFELWVYDPSLTISGTNPQMVYDVAGTSSSPHHFEVLDNKLYFFASDSVSGDELRVYDPAVAASSSNPQLVYDLVPGPSEADPIYLASHNGKLFFSANDANGEELYLFDPSQATGSSNPLIMDLVTGISGSSPESFISLGDYLYIGYFDSTSSGVGYFSVFDDSQPFSLGTNPNNLSTVFDSKPLDLLPLTVIETVVNN